MDKYDLINTFIGPDEYYKQRYDDVVPTLINDILWYSYPHLFSDSEKIQVLFDVLQDFPTYALLMEVSMHYDGKLSEEAKGVFWEQVYEKLSLEDELISKPIAYAIWCDFFEDNERYKKAWDVLTTEPMSDALTKTVLRIAGPIPFDEKYRLYQKLIPETKWHLYIFDSLLASTYESYGQVDKIEALDVLNQLILPPNTKSLSKLKARLLSL